MEDAVVKKDLRKGRPRLPNGRFMSSEAEKKWRAEVEAKKIKIENRNNVQEGDNVIENAERYEAVVENKPEEILINDDETMEQRRGGTIVTANSDAEVAEMEQPINDDQKIGKVAAETKRPAISPMNKQKRDKCAKSKKVKASKKDKLKKARFQKANGYKTPSPGVFKQGKHSYILNDSALRYHSFNTTLHGMLHRSNYGWLGSARI